MSIAHRVYRLIMALLCLPLLGWLYGRAIKEPGYRQGLGQRLGWVQVPAQSLGGIWLHAASVGEAQAAGPLVQALRGQLPAHQITLSCQTPTGAHALRQAPWAQGLSVLYHPLDTPGACGRFLDRLQPRLLILVERELWPEMLAQCRARAISVVLVNARLSETSARRYRRVAPLMQPIWQQLARVTAADNASAQRLAALGVPQGRISVVGNLKFDAPALPAAPCAHAPSLQGRIVIVAASTHAPEEAQLLGAWPTFAQRYPSALLVLVPRHPQRFDAVADLIAQHGLPFVRRSTAQPPQAHTQVLLGDSMGELSMWYRSAHLCFIGGSLAPIGGHNAFEAIAAGKPVLFGPHTQHFASLYADILHAGAGQRIAHAQALFTLAGQWLSQPQLLHHMSLAAARFLTEHQGACQHTLAALQAHLPPAALTQAAGVHTLSLPGGHHIWYDPECFDTLDPSSFVPGQGLARGQDLASTSGRARVHLFAHQGRSFLLRHYHRGGLMARLSRDRFWHAGPVHQSRAMREFALLRQLTAWQLPVPRPAAAHQHRIGCTYRADIIVQWIANTENVAQLLAKRPLQAQEYQALGAAIRQLHDRSVFHADLNCHNLLLDTAGRAWVVDFDKCGFRPQGPWQADNLQRLRRSLRKEKRKNAALHWQESDWAHLMAGYEQRLTP